MIRFLLACGLAIGFVANSYALQVVDGVEGKTIFVRVSIKDFNSVRIDGGRVRSVKATDRSMLHADSDVETGQVLLQPLVKEQFSAFVFSEAGKTYTLVLMPEDIPSETIVIREVKDKKGSIKSGLVEKAGSYESAIKKMMLIITNESVPDGMDVTDGWEEMKLWKGTKFAKERVVRGLSMVGERYKLINTSDEVIKLAEQEFFKNGVLAVTVSRLTIAPGESTNIFVVKRSESADEN